MIVTSFAKEVQVRLLSIYYRHAKNCARCFYKKVALSLPKKKKKKKKSSFCIMCA